MTSKITHNYGEIDEPALSIMVSTVVIGITKIETDSATVAALNLHSLARRYQRGFGNPGDLAILRDIRAVAVAAPDLIADNTFAIPTPSGGCWRGFVGNMLCERDTSRQVVAVRTFV